MWQKTSTWRIHVHLEFQNNLHVVLSSITKQPHGACSNLRLLTPVPISMARCMEAKASTTEPVTDQRYNQHFERDSLFKVGFSLTNVFLFRVTPRGICRLSKTCARDTKAQGQSGSSFWRGAWWFFFVVAKRCKDFKGFCLFKHKKMI